MCFLLLLIAFQVRIVHQEAPLYLESDHEATDPKTSLRSAAQQNTQTQSDPAKLFLLISSAVQQCATHVPVLQCLTAIVINSSEPCIPTHQFVHQMLIFCGFCSLPSQSQVPDSLLRPSLEALFGAQRRVVLPLRGGFQALLSGCTILPIISCSSVALSKCLQMVGQHRPTRVHTGRDAASVFAWVMSKNPWHSSPCPQRRRFVHQLYSGRFLHHQVGCIIHHRHVV